jgi:hypothetical protein
VCGCVCGSIYGFGWVPNPMPDQMSTLIHDFIRPQNKWRVKVFWYDDTVEYRYFVNRDSALDYLRDLQMEFRHRRNYDMVEIRMSEKNSDGVWNEPDYYVIHVSIVNCVRIKRFLTIGSITMMTTTYADNAGTHTTTCTRW